MSRAAALGQAAWQEARAAADFGRFRDALARHLELRHRYVELLHGLRAPLRRAARRLRAGDDDGAAAAAVRRAARGARAARRRRPRGRSCCPFGGEVDVESQRRAVMMVLEGVGFDPDGWRLDVAPHPFAQAIGRGDVRVTTRYDLHDFAGAYFGALHEFGHGLYEAQIPERLGAQPARQPGLARRARVAEPAVGEPRRAQPPVLHLGRAAAGGDPARLRRHRRRRSSTAASTRSTAT